MSIAVTAACSDLLGFGDERVDATGGGGGGGRDAGSDVTADVDTDVNAVADAGGDVDDGGPDVSPDVAQDSAPDVEQDGAADGGWCSQPAPDTGPPLGTLLFKQLFEQPGGCAAEMPPMVPLSGELAPDCDARGSLEGNESALFKGSRSLACTGCFVPAEPRLVAEFALRVTAPFASELTLFGAMLGDVSSPLQTGAQLVLDANGRVALRCAADASMQDVGDLVGSAQVVTLEYDWHVHVAKVWVRPASEGYPVGPRGAPLIGLTCPCTAPPSGFFIQSRGPSGEVAVDSIRVARTRLSIDESY